jgi:hypothetical protein
MTDNPAPREKQQQMGDAGKNKRRYQKPAFHYERVFETQALSCGKTVATQGLCQVQQSSS